MAIGTLKHMQTFAPRDVTLKCEREVPICQVDLCVCSYRFTNNSRIPGCKNRPTMFPGRMSYKATKVLNRRLSSPLA